ncbi:protein trapped in endoderm-1-like isoform X2 [Panulirus ornatus]|uniref:protein trapped in endoderm-1-like isoform X2 n=1 Tax=Panulirus ornatus TaxID=150431 RepID=UPI003A8A5797
MDYTAGLTDYTSSLDYDLGSVSTYDAVNLNTAVEVRLSGEVPSDLSTAVLANLSSVLTTLASSTSTASPGETETTVSTLEVITDILTSTDEDPLSPRTPRYPYGSLGFTAASAFIISILGSFGNLLTIIALPMSKKLRTTATAFVVNLAVVELLFCVFILPMSGAQYLFLQQRGKSLLSNEDCIFFTVVRYTLTQVELQTILAIALTRALAVATPRLYSGINQPVVIGCYIAGIWIYSFCLKLPPAFEVFGEYTFNERTMECDMASTDSKARQTYILVEAVIPVLLIFVLYIFVFVMVIRRAFMRQRKFSKNFLPPAQPTQVKLSSARVARAASRGGGTAKVAPPPSSTASTSSNSGNQRKGSNSSFRSLKKRMSESSLRSRFTHQSSTISQRLSTNRRDMRVARTIFIIFILVLVCSVPVAMVHAVDRNVEFPVRFLLLHVLYWVQYCLNMVVYVLMNQQYRDAYVDCLARVFPRFKQHHGRRFFWEKASISSRPQPNYTSSRPANQGDSSAAEVEQTAAVTQGNNAQGRLTAIPEGHSSSAGNDSVFSDQQKIVQQDLLEKEIKKAEISEDEEGCSDSEGSDQDGVDEEQALVDKEHWITKNGSTGGSLPDDESKV